MDSCVDTIRAYTATDDPQPIAAVSLTHKIHGGNEQDCSWDCGKDGWVTHSRDGKYVYVGDSGDVIDTATHTVATYIDLLSNSRLATSRWTGATARSSTRRRTSASATELTRASPARSRT